MYNTMNYKGMNKKELLDEILTYKNKDVPWNCVLNSICSKPLNIGLEFFTLALDTNLGDNRIFKGTCELEGQLIKLVGNLLNGINCVGNIVSGGTEANILALYNAKSLAKKDAPEVILPETIHFSFIKAINLLNITPRFAKVDSNFRAIPESIENLINDNTIAIIATAGTSEYGSIDPISDIADIAIKHNIYLHVDAATGGFIIPFALNLGYNLQNFDFSINGVSSITIDPHKYGLAPIPSAIILYKDKSYIHAPSVSSFFNGTKKHTTLLGTRSGAPILATYSILKHLGIEGFNNITKNNFKKRDYLIQLLQSHKFKLLLNPDLTIVDIIVSDSDYILNKLEEENIIVSSLKRIPNTIRIVINNHVSYNMLDTFVNKLCFLEDLL